MDDELQRELPKLLPRLWRFALRLTSHEADAQDLVQRSYLRALERRHQWRPGTSAISWMFAIMYSIWMNELRSVRRRREGNLADDQSFDDFETTNRSGDPEYQLLCKQVIQAVQTLPDAQRVVLLFVEVEGMSYRESADALDIPIGTLMSRLARARLAIGQLFSQRDPTVATIRPGLKPRTLAS
jgi:RNA polymerase sigma-70 factor, ECF subfamily